MSYRLTRRAELDLIGIYRFGAETFGLAQADSYHDRLEAMFRLLSEQPLLARERTEIDPPVRVHPCGSHVIVYVTTDDGDVLIVRVRHGSEDWESDELS